MRKLLTLLVFLAITGLTAGCGASPVDLAAHHRCGDGGSDPNGWCIDYDD